MENAWAARTLAWTQRAMPLTQYCTGFEQGPFLALRKPSRHLEGPENMPPTH